jgi:hypothetical protein
MVRKRRILARRAVVLAALVLKVMDIEGLVLVGITTMTTNPARVATTITATADRPRAALIVATMEN